MYRLTPKNGLWINPGLLLTEEEISGEPRPEPCTTCKLAPCRCDEIYEAARDRKAEKLERGTDNDL